MKLCLEQNPLMRKSPNLHFDKESEGYLLSPMPPRSLVLLPFERSFPDTIDKVKDLPKEWSTTFEF